MEEQSRGTRAQVEGRRCGGGGEAHSFLKMIMDPLAATEVLLV